MGISSSRPAIRRHPASLSHLPRISAASETMLRSLLGVADGLGLSLASPAISLNSLVNLYCLHSRELQDCWVSRVEHCKVNDFSGYEFIVVSVSIGVGRPGCASNAIGYILVDYSSREPASVPTSYRFVPSSPFLGPPQTKRTRLEDRVIVFDQDPSIVIPTAIFKGRRYCVCKYKDFLPGALCMPDLLAAGPALIEEASIYSGWHIARCYWFAAVYFELLCGGSMINTPRDAHYAEPHSSTQRVIPEEQVPSTQERDRGFVEGGTGRRLSSCGGESSAWRTV